MKYLRIWLAHRRLNRLITKSRQSFETQDYAKRREAGKLGWQRRKAAA